MTEQFKPSLKVVLLTVDVCLAKQEGENPLLWDAVMFSFLLLGRVKPFDLTLS